MGLSRHWRVSTPIPTGLGWNPLEGYTQPSPLLPEEYMPMIQNWLLPPIMWHIIKKCLSRGYNKWEEFDRQWDNNYDNNDNNNGDISNSNDNNNDGSYDSNNGNSDNDKNSTNSFNNGINNYDNNNDNNNDDGTKNCRIWV